MNSQYDNPKLWTLVSDEAGKDYVSTAAPEPLAWRRERRVQGFFDVMVYTSGNYEIRGHESGRDSDNNVVRRSYTVWRQGVELPLSLTSRLRDAKARALKNARGEDRMHVA